MYFRERTDSDRYKRFWISELVTGADVILLENGTTGTYHPWAPGQSAACTSWCCAVADRDYAGKWRKMPCGGTDNVGNVMCAKDPIVHPLLVTSKYVFRTNQIRDLIRCVPYYT